MKNSSFSIRAIESMARIAAVKAEINKTAQHSEQSKVYKQKARRSHKSNFETQVNAFRKALTSALPAEEYRIVFDHDSRKAGKATVKVFKVADLERQKEELKEHRAQLSRGIVKNDLPKPFQAQFTAMYVLYPDTMGSDRLESVAIYGDGAIRRCAAISQSGVLFGFPVRSATVEIGRRPFVDVHLR